MHRPRNFYVSLIIPLYFIIAFVPVLMKSETEYFPFFSFKLFSKIPNGFTHYDLVFDEDTGKENFLLYNNKSLSRLERRYYERWLTVAVEEFEKTGTLDLESHSELFKTARNVRLVKMSGDYVHVVLDSEFMIETVAIVR